MHRPSALLRLVLVAVLGAVAGVACAGPAASSEVASRSDTGVVITAEGVAFDPLRLELPADTRLHVVFRNRDPMPHGLTVATRTSGVPPRDLGELPAEVGPVERDFDLAPLAPGPYLFSCPVHPAMQIEVDAR